MECKKCGKLMPQDAIFCPYCGKSLVPSPRTPRRRGNGQGSVYQLPGGKYKAIVITGWYLDDDGKKHRKTRSAVFDKKKDAVAALPKLHETPKQERKANITFKALYDAWIQTHRAGKATIDCYKSAIKYYESLYGERVADIDVDDLQECIDACPRGRRTKENMRTTVGLMYKYGIPRHLIPENLNLSQFLKVDGEHAAHRESFTDVQLAQIQKACGTVPGAEDIMIMCYTGFRPSEYLALTDKSYDSKAGTLRGGAKTAAGKNRLVTISPKIKPLIEKAVQTPGPIARTPDGCAWDLKLFTDQLFYPALESVGIDNPIVDIAGGAKRHKYTPHSCRHTFSTLMKRVEGSDKDKLSLIGHTSTEMLRYYQDAPVDDLRRITDAL